MPKTITSSNTIHYIFDEEIASASITPGHLIEHVPSGGDEGQLRVHATAAGAVAQPMWAVENEIEFDPTAGLFGENVNLDDTRRDGVTLSWLAQVIFSVTVNRLNDALQYAAAQEK